jgi:hypothetical protein
MSTTTKTVESGVEFGTVMAIVLSWSTNHSILWAILHGLLSWVYVVYWAIWQAA